MLDSTKRFSNRVDNYVNYRPGYPEAVLECLSDECGLTSAAIIADVGSGTGNLSKLFLDWGNAVYGVEPNDEMRSAAESLLSRYPHFTSINGTAEGTTLAGDSVDFVTAGQAFHWFDTGKARAEFSRILKPRGMVALIWNQRRASDIPFMVAYEGLLEEYGISYGKVKQTNKYDELLDFFGGEVQQRRFDNAQQFDFPSLTGRFLSSSYAPLPGHPDHIPMIASLEQIFDSYQEDGFVSFSYWTRLFFGLLVD